MNKQQTGRKGEDIAVQYLQNQGFRVLERNWRFGHCEIDIIACRGGMLHFVEVKTRSGLRYGYPEASINRLKMKHLRVAAAAFHYRHPKWKYIQFDALSVLLQGETILEIRFFEDIYY
ncbi:MAG: YraN family protein [Sediminibacterium sp.]|nr:YraN family protein [Sediminibacterium sp.]